MPLKNTRSTSQRGRRVHFDDAPAGTSGASNATTKSSRKSTNKKSPPDQTRAKKAPVKRARACEPAQQENQGVEAEEGVAALAQPQEEVSTGSYRSLLSWMLDTLLDLPLVHCCRTCGLPLVRYMYEDVDPPEKESKVL